MLVRQPMVILAALALIVAACAETALAPGSPPAETVPPPPTEQPPTPTPTPDEPMPTPAAAPTGTPVSQDPDDYYGDPYGGGGVVATPTPAPEGDTTLEVFSSAGAGDYLVGPAGLALYTFDNDRAGMSMCTGTCAQTWPPLTVDDGTQPTAGPGVTGTLGLITRADGSSQVTYNDLPLYYFAGDQSMEDTTGDGVSGAWHLARPDAGAAGGGGGSPEY